MSVENMNVPAGQNPSQPAMSEDDEFDAAMAEATADEGAPAHAAADPDSDGPASGTGEPPVPADEAATQATPAAGNAPSGNPDNSDIWANAPPELKAAYEQERRDAELRFKSVQGRQSAADRELERLRAEHAEMQRRLQSNPSSKEANQGTSESETPDPYKQLVEDYPEIAGPLVENLKKLQSELSQVQQGVGTFQQERELTYYKQQQDLLTEKQPDWLTVLGDERFGGWLQEQPKAVQETFERNSKAIVDGNEAAWLVGQFKTALGIGAQSAPQQQQQPSPEASRRAKQLASGRDFSGGSGAPVAEGIPDDFDAALNAYAEQEDAQRRRR
jgi:hypothetical protein